VSESNARGHRGRAKTDSVISIPGWRGWKTPLTLGYYLSRFQRYEKVMPLVVFDLDNFVTFN